jgi:hypothetical protein
MVAIRAYDSWLSEVKSSLASINMPFDSWQSATPFDFHAEYDDGTTPSAAAERANRFWWRKQNERINQDCRLTQNCWLPRNHHGNCEPQ